MFFLWKTYAIAIKITLQITVHISWLMQDSVYIILWIWSSISSLWMKYFNSLFSLTDNLFLTGSLAVVISECSGK